LRGSITDAEISARLEAALYSAGRPLSVDELVKASGTNSREKTTRILKELANKITNVFNAIEIAKLEDGSFVFQLKPEYTPMVRRYAQHPIIAAAALKTLSYIAYEQPVTSKRLVQIRGSQAYHHLKELEQMSFIEHENVGRIKVYRTTKQFKEYFGVHDINSMKSKLVATANNSKSSDSQNVERS
jgi:segregation and condensation protein B